MGNKKEILQKLKESGQIKEKDYKKQIEIIEKQNQKIKIYKSVSIYNLNLLK